MKKNSLFLISIVFVMFQIVAAGCNSERNPDINNITKASSENHAEKTHSSNEIGNFITAAKAVTPAVVHIKTTHASTGSRNAGGQFYGSPSTRGVIQGSGSGVIIDQAGYIATNNHVVEGASGIEVILPDKRVFTATLIGRDPNTDLALIKVDADSLPVVSFGNSDLVEVGEWVLAIGYPFSLNTTVTAGIISAKARSIGIINRPGRNNPTGNIEQTGNTAIESFLQTDAAINPGNSGGALVNTNGKLIGINSAIASYTGSYAGYAFAIPVNLAKKILDDLRNYGAVKRGVLGVSFPAPSAEDQYLKQQGLNPATVKGVYITGVMAESAAAALGLEEGDIIQSIDGVQLSSSSEFSERIARHKPGDVIKLSFMRNGKILTGSATLKGEEQMKTATNTNKSLEEIYKRLGASFSPVTAELKQRFNINAGVMVKEVDEGGFFEQIGIPAGTIIAFVNGRPIDTPKDIEMALLSAQSGMIQILAIAVDGSKVVFNFSLGT